MKLKVKGLKLRDEGAARGRGLMARSSSRVATGFTMRDVVSTLQCVEPPPTAAHKSCRPSESQHQTTAIRSYRQQFTRFVFSSRMASSSMTSLVIVMCLLTSTPIDALFSAGFVRFLINNYGQEAADTINRPDLGILGSFGGGESSVGVELGRDPIVFMHGLTQTAASMTSLRDYFYDRGYNKSQLFGTSYGPLGRPILFDDESSCEHYKAIRLLIIAVSKYTGRRVQVTGCSMGSPTSRKAILGGRCVDTGEDLGEPLTPIVSAFISQAGANNGGLLCVGLTGTRICNEKMGLAYNAEWLVDLRKTSGYEAPRRYMLRSKTDMIVGYDEDGIFPSQLPGATMNVTLDIFEHISLCVDTKRIQYALLTTGGLTRKNVAADTPFGATVERTVGGRRVTQRY